MSQTLRIFEIKNSRESEEGPLAMEQIFSAAGSGGGHGGFLSFLFGNKHTPKYFSLEIVASNASIHFFIAGPDSFIGFLESQLTAQYPKLVFIEAGDYMPHFVTTPHVAGQLVLGSYFYYPLKTHKDIRDLDIFSSVLGQFAKIPSHEAVVYQIRIEPAGNSWQQYAQKIISSGVPDPNNPARSKTHPQARLIESKASQVGYQTAVRLLAVSENKDSALRLLNSVAGTFGVYTLGDGNNMILKMPAFWQIKKFDRALEDRSGVLASSNHIFTSSELASLWHPPWLGLSAIKNIAWGSKLTGEPPDNLPVATENEEEKKLINFFARTEFKNKTSTFGIKKDDRRKHIYMVGKTGTGKSTAIANMVINDMRNGEGVAVIDPHGDLCDILLDYVPSFRINDVAYLDPSDTNHPFRLNPLEVKNDAFKELVASGIVAIFHKLYHYSWGPRLEYILRNAIMTLLHVPQTTLLNVPEILTNDRYRERVVEKLDDQVLKNFWLNEFNKMSPQLRVEATSPILNKVGQFLTSQTIRNIVGHPTSTIDLEDMMNEGKIVMVNLSQGKLGEDASALLGSMIITKFQLAAMNRVYQGEKERRDFYLYVDEFQNFATNSFIKILSEARKYRLDLTLANQYIGQIDEDVQKAIFGNAGSLMSFGVGAEDARLLSREFGSKYEEAELVQLGNFLIILKLSIDNYTSEPFSATTLPLPKSKNQNREKVIRASRERYGKKLI